MNTIHGNPSQKALDTLNALKAAVAKALERKKRLGQYAVVWLEGRPVAVGDDAPPGADKR